MQRPISGFNQDDMEKLAKEQEKNHLRLTQAANPSKIPLNSAKARGYIPGSKAIPKTAQAH